jgi:hypothetical protein
MKSYSKSQSLQYKQRLHSARLLRKAFKPSSRNFKKAGPLRSETATVVANVMDVANFLARYLSGKQNVVVSTRARDGYSSEVIFAPREVYRINLPNWEEYDLPLEGFDKYRIYRSGVFHESCHVKYTPPSMFKYGTGIEHDVFNILEDRRIEDLGVEEWPGYLPERIYTRAYAYALRPNVDAIQLPELARYEAFLQRLLIGKIKGKLSPQDMEKIEETAEHVERELQKLKGANEYTVEKRMAELTNDVIKKLDLPLNMAPPPQYGSHSSWTGTFTEDHAKDAKAQPEKVEQEMEEFFKEEKSKAKHKERKDGKTSPTEITEEDVDKAKEGTTEVRDEYNKVQSKKPVEDPTIVGWLPVASQGIASLYRDQKFITAMNTHLRTWKTGYKEHISEKGSRLSIPSYIRHKEEPFATRIKQSARGKKLLVVADFSGSISPREEEYKRAIISAMEVLSGIGSNIAFFTFGSDPAQGDGFFKVKTFEEPKWSNIHSSKVAALEARYGSTPTDYVYQKLEGYIAKSRPHVTVTITDGAPDRPLDTAECVKKLRKHTRMVAFGIAPGDDPSLKNHMEYMLKSQGYNKSFVVKEVHEIPPKLVKMIAPE